MIINNIYKIHYQFRHLGLPIYFTFRAMPLHAFRPIMRIYLGLQFIVLWWLFSYAFPLLFNESFACDNMYAVYNISLCPLLLLLILI